VLRSIFEPGTSRKQARNRATWARHILYASKRNKLQFIYSHLRHCSEFSLHTCLKRGIETWNLTFGMEKWNLTFSRWWVINITVMCGVTLCNLVGRYERFGDTNCLSLQGKLRWQQILPKRWFLPNYRASYPIRRRSWGNEMLVIVHGHCSADVVPGWRSSHFCTLLYSDSQLESLLCIIKVKLCL
jgi:hypothetical protein